MTAGVYLYLQALYEHTAGESSLLPSGKRWDDWDPSSCRELGLEPPPARMCGCRNLWGAAYDQKSPLKPHVSLTNAGQDILRVNFRKVSHAGLSKSSTAHCSWMVDFAFQLVQPLLQCVFNGAGCTFHSCSGESNESTGLQGSMDKRSQPACANMDATRTAPYGGLTNDYIRCLCSDNINDFCVCRNLVGEDGYSQNPCRRWPQPDEVEETHQDWCASVRV